MQKGKKLHHFNAFSAFPYDMHFIFQPSSSLQKKGSYRIPSLFKVILYQKGNAFLFYQHLTMKRGNYLIRLILSIKLTDSFNSDCNLCVSKAEKIRSDLLSENSYHFFAQICQMSTKIDLRRSPGIC